MGRLGDAVLSGLRHDRAGLWHLVHGLARNPVSKVMPALLLLPVFVIIESIVLLGEEPSLIVLLGGGIVLEGIAIIFLADLKPRARSLRPHKYRLEIIACDRCLRLRRLSINKCQLTDGFFQTKETSDMARVTVEDCVDKVPNRFELVLLASHRARAISQGAC